MKKIITAIILPLLLSVSVANAALIADFNLKTFVGNKDFNLYKDTKGKKVLINFWASWCTACIKELGELEELKKAHPDTIFIAINAGEKDSKIKRFFKRHKFTYIILKDKNKAYSKSVGVLKLPQTFVLDRNKNITYQGSIPPKKI